jgi:hypothetical protein
MVRGPKRRPGMTFDLPRGRLLSKGRRRPPSPSPEGRVDASAGERPGGDSFSHFDGRRLSPPVSSCRCAHSEPPSPPGRDADTPNPSRGAKAPGVCGRLALRKNPRARGTPGRSPPRSPAHVEGRNECTGLKSPRSAELPRRSARGGLGLASHDPRWTDLSGSSPLSGHRAYPPMRGRSLYACGDRHRREAKAAERPH